MELLDLLNAASFLVTQPAADAADAEEEEPKPAADQLCEYKFANHVARPPSQVRHHFITQPDSNDPSPRPRFERSLPLNMNTVK